MNCFSMIRKLIENKFYNHDPILPISKAPESSPAELQPMTKERKPSPKKPCKNSDEEDDLFKEMEPKYVAARRIGATMLATENNKTTTRFDMDIESGNSWEVEDLN